MSFIPFSFVVLYLVAMAMRWGLPLLFKHGNSNGASLRITSLLALSWVFYAWHVPWYILLILASTVVDYVAARGIQSTPATRLVFRRSILATSLLTNLAWEAVRE